MWPSHKLVCRKSFSSCLSCLAHPPFAISHPPFPVLHSPFAIPYSPLALAIAASTSMRQFDTPQGDGCIQSDMAKQDIQDIQQIHTELILTLSTVCSLHSKLLSFHYFILFFCLVTFWEMLFVFFSLWQLNRKKKTATQEKIESWK